MSLPLLALGLLVLSFRRSGQGARESLLLASVVWSALLTVATELLSLGDALTATAVGLWWAGVCAGAILMLRRTPRAAATPGALRWRSLPAPWKVGLGSVAAIAAALLAIALLAAPSTWDSMTYHMSRVAHWVQNRSVAPYPTHILRQLHQAPWAEYAITHFQLLSGGDRFAALVQWLAYLGSLSAVSLIARQLGARERGQALAAVIAATVPMVILQASGTQNDLVVGYWALCVVSLGLRVVTGEDDAAWWLVLAFGGALGLAVLSKATAYVFLFPFIVWFGFRLLRRGPTRVALLQAGVVALAALTLNAGFFARNIRIYGSPLGPGQEGDAYGYTNTVFSAGSLVSNTVRNLALHAGTLTKVDYKVVEPALRGALRAIGQNPDDPRTTWPGTSFRVPHRSFHEDSAGNPLHLAILAVAIAVFALSRRRNPPRVAYLAALLGGFVLFSFILKWQPWHSRLHVPFFLMAASWCGAVLEGTPRRVAEGVAAVLLLAATPWVLENASRPLIGSGRLHAASRSDGYFVNRPGLAGPYREAAARVRAGGCREVGLVSGADDFEYPLWPLLHAEPGPVRIDHVLVDNPSAAAPPPRPVPCAILSLVESPPEMLFLRGESFIRQWSETGIALYAPTAANGAGATLMAR